MSRMALVTGAAGYIGSHACLKLIEAGYDVIAFDNFSNSKTESLRRVSLIGNKKIPIVEGDIRCKKDIKRALGLGIPDVVFHFAGLKSVTESIRFPDKYYSNNTLGTLVLAETLIEHDCKKIIFSSSATVYGGSSIEPIDESSSVNPGNPYGRSKLAAENILLDMASAVSSFNVAILRYFNPVGAHPSGLIGEDPIGEPANLLPYVAQVAIGRRNYLKVYGTDWPTLDGTGVRDFIHVEDLVEGHLAAADFLQNKKESLVLNLGTGSGLSVLQIIKSFEQASGEKINREFVDRRPGDVAQVVANAKLASKLINWKAKRDVMDMCIDHWRWQKSNPSGYTLDTDKL